MLHSSQLVSCIVSGVGIGTSTGRQRTAICCRKGIDYKFTFSTTIGADAFRWFLSVACTCGMMISGLDISTVYLTADQCTPL